MNRIYFILQQSTIAHKALELNCLARSNSIIDATHRRAMIKGSKNKLPWFAKFQEDRPSRCGVVVMMIFLPYREVPHNVEGHVSVAVPRMPAVGAEIRTSGNHEAGFCPKMV